MSARSRRNQPAEPMFPGMPDLLPKQPPKAGASSWQARTLDEAIAYSYDLLDRAIVQFSTGNATSTRKVTGKPPSDKALAAMTDEQIHAMISDNLTWDEIRAGAENTAELLRMLQSKEKIKKEAVVDYGPRELAGIYGLYSGGRDSVNTQHLLRMYMKDRPLFRHFFGGIIHVNTGTAIQATTDHVRETVPAWGMKLHELAPRVDYLDIVLGNVRATTGPNIGRPVWVGFPGPTTQAHSVMYRRLKDEPLQQFRAQRVGRDGARRKVMYIGGMRWAESDKRFRTAEEIDVDGGIVWVSPVVHWTNEHMREYRDRYRCEKAHKHQPHRLCGDEALPTNPVTEHLHMSGDCACGAYAKPGEKEERRFFYPEHAAEIDRWEKAVRDADIPACTWGQAPPKGFEQGGAAAGKSVIERLCAKCAPELDGQTDLLDLWQASGLISPEQAARLANPAA